MGRERTLVLIPKGRVARGVSWKAAATPAWWSVLSVYVVLALAGRGGIHCCVLNVIRQSVTIVAAVEMSPDRVLIVEEVTGKGVSRQEER